MALMPLVLFGGVFIMTDNIFLITIWGIICGFGVVYGCVLDARKADAQCDQSRKDEANRKAAEERAFKERVRRITREELQDNGAAPPE